MELIIKNPVFPTLKNNLIEPNMCLRIHTKDTNYIYDILFQPEIYVHCFCQMSTMFPREPGIWCGPGIRCRNWKTSGLELNEIKGKIIDQHKGQKQRVMI